jgi:hypothetical protein
VPNLRGRQGVLSVMTRALLPLLAALTLALPATASAATDGTSNTLMAAELRPRPVVTGFMDYTDDALVSSRRP